MANRIVRPTKFLGSLEKIDEIHRHVSPGAEEDACRSQGDELAKVPRGRAARVRRDSGIRNQDNKQAKRCFESSLKRPEATWPEISMTANHPR